jgi:MFS family permease
MSLSKSVFFRIYSFLLVFLLAVSFGRGFLSLWYIQHDFSYLQIAAFYLIDFIVPCLIILVTKNFSIRKTIPIALVSEILLMITVFHFSHPFQLYVAGVLAGITVVLFYVPYNILYFQNTSKKRRAFSSSLVTLAGPFLSIIVPVIGGYLGQRFGLSSVFVFAGLILLTNLYLVHFLPREEYNIGVLQSLRRTTRTNILLILEGLKESITIAAIPLFTLFFIRQPLPYGLFVSYLAIIASIATVFLGFVSDKFKKRTVILYPITILVALSIIMLGFSQNLTLWAMVCGVLGFLISINSTFVTTLVLDKSRSVVEGMVSREFLLGAGRTIGVLFIIGSLVLTGNPKTAFILVGILYLFFPVLVYLKRVYH